MSINRILTKIRNLSNFSRDLSKFRFSRVKMVRLEEIKGKNERSQELLDSLKEELSAMQKEMIRQKKLQLRQENAKLQQQVDVTRQQLMALMKRNGKQCIPVPGARDFCTAATGKNESEAAVPIASSERPTKNVDAPKEKKPKKEKTAPAISAVPELPIDVGRLDMRVGKIIEVARHPDADTLYVEKIDCGEAKPRTVVSGLVKHVSIEQMQDRLVIVLCNLKPAKMRGVTSEAMVMCASLPDKVEILNPPSGAVPGDLVSCESYQRQPDAQLNPKKKIFETVAPDLMTNSEMVATYKGKPMYVPGKDVIKAPTLCNAQVK